jgi:ubiquinone/menaquinone biosynthesis C-methylase UbiE
VRIPRSITYVIRHVLDDWLPPVVRDRRAFMWPFARILFGKDAALFLDFKARALNLSDEEFADVYQSAHQFVIQRETDLTKDSLHAVLESVVGDVLEVGCGSGYLASQLAKHHRVTACDIHVNESLPGKFPHITFVNASASKLPFSDKSFDTVVSTHVLEHVQDIDTAVRELRRVARKRIVIVVPRQRPYQYTFDLHLHFFPYEYTIISALNPHGSFTCRDLSGDWVYVENLNAPGGHQGKSNGQVAPENPS